MAQANVKLTVDASQATRALQGVQNKSTQLNGGLNRLKTAIAGVGLTVLARQAVGTASNFQALQLRMKVLTSEFGEFAGAQELVRKAQDKFNLSIVEATKGVTDIFARLRPLGLSLKDIETTFIGFNTIAKLAGLNATEASAAFTQLAQGLGSGRLQGDEFRSIAEQVPQLLKAISDETGIAAGKLKDFASKGLLETDIILRALAKSAKEGADKIGAIMDASPAEVFKEFSNAVLELQLSLGSKLLPTILKVTKATTALTEAVIKFIDSPIGQASFIIGGIALAAKGLPVLLLGVSAGLMKVAAAGGFVTIALNAIPFVAVATGIGAIVTQLIKQRQEQDKVTQAIKNGEKAQLEALEADLGIKMAKEIAILNRSNDRRTVEAAKRRLAALRDEMKPIKERLDIVIQENAAEEKKNKTIKENKDIQEEINKLIKDNLAKAIAYEQAEMDAAAAKGKLIDHLSNQKALAQAALDGNLEQVKTQQEINALVAIHGEGMRDVITAYIEGTNALKDQKTELDNNAKAAQKIVEKFDEIGQAIETSIKNNLTDAITGAQSFGDAMIGVLNKIRDRIIANQLDNLLGNFGSNFSSGARGGERKGLGGFIGGFLGGLFKENGGPVKAGQPYIVGERQPELFVPRTSGTILPSVPSGGGGTTNMITVNVDASGTSVQGNGSEADQLGGLIASVVQATIIDEQRAGGLLNR